MQAKQDDDITILLKEVVDHFNNEDRATREAQVRFYRRLKLYWNNLSQIYWDDTAKDYKLFGRDDTMVADLDQQYYDKPVNVFRSFLETIIAALSVQVPAVACVPDDADSPLDVSTAKAGDKIAEQIAKHNNSIFLWLNGLYKSMTEGMIGSYTYPKKDEKYGTFEEPQYEDEEIEGYQCPECGSQVPDAMFEAVKTTNKIKDEFGPDDDDVDLHDVVENEGELVCPECAEALDPELAKTKLLIPRFVGNKTIPKTRVCIEVYGGLNIKIANYALTQAETPYLRFAKETNYTNALAKYPWMRKDMPEGGWSDAGITDVYEAFARLNPEYRGEVPLDLVTESLTWLRPSSFDVLTKSEAKKLRRRFPDGAKVAMVNDTVAEYENENLDDCWTLTRNPLSDYLTHDPLGSLLTNIQDITNDLISLILQTIEHGVSQTWVDPGVVNLNGQRQIEAAPGTLTAVKTLAGGKSVKDAFFESKTASLSPEVIPFYNIIQQLGQFVSGALPSLFGGAQDNGSNTASQYAMSRQMAMQRLNTPWKMMILWWKDTFSKAIPVYMNLLEGDERFVEKDDKGRFLNVYIRKAEIEGKIGRVELEAAETIPITEEQTKQMIMEIMNLNNNALAAAMMSPENLPMLRKLVKIPEFKIPGEQDRIKQQEEILILVNTKPEILPADQSTELTPEDMMAGKLPPQDIELPSVMVDPIIDNHEIEANACREWLVGPVGRLAKSENPDGYKNVMLHMKAHLDQIQQNMTTMASSAAPNPQATPPEEVPAEKQAEPEKIEGAASARTPIE